ncbi:MAG: 23S rRNA (uracil(1939)-C(5))-methyltransferase RlmD [Clostridiales bacterium]|nr:23S rRNA (uracil(1939)-C(5))-methyltransferase RlmD [Clostridiales bacterium]
MNKNDVFEIEITGMTDDGSGVGRAEGIAVFVPYTIVGETVRTHIIKVNKTYAIGKLLEVVVPAQTRVKAECPYFYRCGGCQLWHMDYSEELKFKQNKVSDCIKRIAGLDVPVSEIIGADCVSRYRNKVQLPVSNEGIGFYRRNSHDVIDMYDCLLQSTDTKKIIDSIRKWMCEYDIEPYDEKEKSGNIRHIYTRSCDGGIMVVIVTKEDELPNKKELISAISDTKLKISGIIQNINTRDTNVVLGRKNIILWGREFVSDKLDKLNFEISPNSFYQVNKTQMLKLYSEAKRMAGLTGHEMLWDVYCGIGTIGQFMADKCGRVVGIEIVPEAVENARENARLNNIKNAEYYCGAAEKLAPVLVGEGLKPDVVILDPPRRGCDERLLNTIIKVKPKRIVYISCKPSTLARDLKYLNSNGYTPQKIVPVDMFPRTCHVETVVLLSQLKQKPDDYINVTIELDDMDITSAETKATYDEIKKYVAEHNAGMKVSNLYISQVKRKCGIEVGKNYNSPKNEDSRQPQCPEDKESAIVEALKHFKMNS